MTTPKQQPEKLPTAQGFLIPPHDQAPQPMPAYICPRCYQSTRERDGTCALCNQPAASVTKQPARYISAELQAVEEILEEEARHENQK